MTATDPEKPSLWKRIQGHILHPDLSAKQVAWSFAVGLAIAMNPALGTHTWVALGVCFFAKRLHRPLLLSATFINNPWTMVPIASLSVFLGNWLLGRGWTIDLSSIAWDSVGLASFTTRTGFSEMLTTLEPILLPYFLGGLALSAIAAPTGYWFMLWLTVKLRKKHGG
jgi:uncharacterized protein (DUF2062 family)